MSWIRLQLRPLLIAAWLALGAQGVLAFEAAWHHHEDAPAGHQDTCAVCIAVAQSSQPVDPPAAVPAPELYSTLPLLSRSLPAHCFALPQLTSRGPPCSAAA